MALSLENTPTWAFASVFFVVIFIALPLVHSINFVGRWFKKQRKSTLFEAIEKLKEELMLLGFISILLGVTQRTIPDICVPISVAHTMLPCRIHGGSMTIPTASTHCASKGMRSMVTQDGIHQLHIFIFVLAVVHVLCGVATMALGKAKMKRWKAWEKETQTIEYQLAHDPNRFKLTRDTTFARRHKSTSTPSHIHMWTICFFRQFYNSIAKVDYLTLRHGFISAHFSRCKTFNFQKYVRFSLEEDFKVVFRISPVMWFLVVIFMLIDIHGWYSYFWLSFIPLIMVLAVGAKLQTIVAKMAFQLNEQKKVVTGVPLVQPNDDLFWFNNPKLVLFLLHLTLFQNAFELSFFVWIWYEYGLRSCYHENFGITIARVLLALIVQFICSYTTLPTYALVTQMGSESKREMFGEATKELIRRWHEDVKNKRKEQLC